MKKLTIILVALIILVISFFYDGANENEELLFIKNEDVITETLDLENLEQTINDSIVEDFQIEETKDAQELEDFQNEEIYIEEELNNDFDEPVIQKIEPQAEPQAELELEKDETIIPLENQDIQPLEKEKSVSITVRCDTILNNFDKLSLSKQDLVPTNGIIYQNENAVLNDDESVFNILLRELKASRIHFEYANTPVYNSAYIEGINNLYEFDCGEGSGWMYKVNNWFPNYGISSYILKDGDVIEIVYSCDLGQDIGGKNSYE